MKKKYTIIIILSVLVILIVLYNSLFVSKKVETIKIKKGNLITVVYATGRVTADTMATLRSESGGIVKYLNAIEGSSVKKGQLLLRTDQSDMLLNLRQAESDLKTAQVEFNNEKLNYDRKKNLIESNTIPQNDYEDAKKNYELANLKVEQQNILLDKAKQKLSETEIYAPFNGIIVTSRVNMGDYLTPDNICFELVSPMSIIVEGDVDEQDLSRLSVGQKSVIAFDAFPGVKFNAFVYRIVPKTNEETKTSKVYLRLYKKPTGLNVGMTATINIETGRKNNVLLIPRTSVVNADGGSYVFLINSHNYLQKINIEVGSNYSGKYTELIRGGLQEGDYIADNPSLSLKDGMKVEMVKK